MTSTTPVPENSSPSTPPSTPPSATQKLPASLRRLLLTTDRTILRLNALFASPGSIDNVLCTISYSLVLCHSHISALLDRRLTALATTIAKNASEQLLPGETLIATVEAPKSTSRLSAIASGSKNMSELISDYRIFVRLWGLLGLYTWARDTYASPPEDRMTKVIAWAQIGANVFFQALENVAYLASHQVIPNVPKQRQNRWWALSSRFWCADVLLSLVRLARQRQLWKREAGAAGGEEKEQKMVRRKREAKWMKEIGVNAAYAPMTLHWSLEEGMFSEWLIGVLGTIAGGLSLRERWRETADRI